jgi:hypothetical protein
MRIRVKSNFVVPGLNEKDALNSEASSINLRQFLELLSRLSPSRIEYVRPGARMLDPDDWELEINGTPYQETRDGLETLLKDEDTVTIKIMAFGGG